MGSSLATWNLQPYLEGVTPGALPGVAEKLDDWASELPEASREARRAYADEVVGAALATALHKRGWKIHTETPGAVWLQAGDMEIHPFEVMEDLTEGALSADTWQEQVRSAGISTLELGTAVEETSRGTAIDDILDFFDEATSQDTLLVVGMGSYGNERRDALQAQASLNEGNVTKAKTHLEAVAERCN